MSKNDENIRQARDNVAARLLLEYQDLDSDYARKQFFVKLLEFVSDESIIIMDFGFSMAPRKDSNNG